MKRIDILIWSLVFLAGSHSMRISLETTKTESSGADYNILSPAQINQLLIPCHFRKNLSCPLFKENKKLDNKNPPQGNIDNMMNDENGKGLLSENEKLKRANDTGKENLIINDITFAAEKEKDLRKILKKCKDGKFKGKAIDVDCGSGEYEQLMTFKPWHGAIVIVMLCLAACTCGIWRGLKGQEDQDIQLEQTNGPSDRIMVDLNSTYERREESAIGLSK